ncbi:MAG: hypothetical protein LBD42_05530 [Desulfovibrio sp.]|nr:hypothetical protein [Desulfovibrio sp.]
MILQAGYGYHLCTVECLAGYDNEPEIPRILARRLERRGYVRDCPQRQGSFGRHAGFPLSHRDYV